MPIRAGQRTAALAVATLIVVGLLLPRAVEANVTYGYDALGRITTALYDNGLCIIYTYDANGNRTAWTNFSPPPATPPVWGSSTWGSFNWSSAPQKGVYGSGGVWGCAKWTAP